MRPAAYLEFRGRDIATAVEVSATRRTVCRADSGAVRSLTFMFGCVLPGSLSLHGDHEIHFHRLCRRVRNRAGTYRRRARILCTHILPEGIWRAWAGESSCAMQRFVQSTQGYSAGHALSGCTARGNETRSLHTRSRLRRASRSAASIRDFRALVRIRADGRESPHGLRSLRSGARISDARRRRGSVLSNVGGIRAE